MNRYTPDQLQKMAMDFLFLDGAGDPRADLILGWIRHYTKLTATQIRGNIRELSRYTE